MSDAWESYFCNVNDELASVFVDVGIATKVPDRKRPHLLWIWVEMQKPRPDGLSSREEAEVLWKLEDSLTAALAKGYKAVLAGRITTQGRREFYFYAAKKPKDDSMLASALTKFQRYQYEWGTKEDPSWDQYFSVLYPSAEDFEKIKNRHVLESLEKHGDNLVQPREVRHWIYFKAAGDREHFAADIRELGFTVHSTSEDQKEEYPFGICVSRVDKVDADSIDDVVLSVFHCAKDARGQYDGWETEVIVSRN